MIRSSGHIRTPALALFALLALASCAPAAPPRASVVARQGTTVRTSCPDHAPELDDDPDHVAALGDRTIERICILGASSEESRASIARAIGVREGDKLDIGRIRAALEAIVELKTMDDATIAADVRGQGVVILLVEIRERPRVEEAVFEGAHAFADKRLNEKGPIQKNSPLDRRVVTAVVKAMEAEYGSRGYGAAKVSAAIEPTSPGHVRVRFVVSEGPEWKIAKLAFPGAKRVLEADLRKATILHEGDAFDADQVERATLLMMSVYFDRGMILTRIAEPQREVASDGRITLSWTIDESDVFRIGTLRFAALGEPLQKELSAETKSQPRSIFDRSKLTADLARVQAFFKARGKMVEALPQTKIDATRKTVDLVIDVVGR